MKAFNFATTDPEEFANALLTLAMLTQDFMQALPTDPRAETATQPFIANAVARGFRVGLQFFPLEHTIGFVLQSPTTDNLLHLGAIVVSEEHCTH